MSAASPADGPTGAGQPRAAGRRFCAPPRVGPTSQSHSHRPSSSGVRRDRAHRASRRPARNGRAGRRPPGSLGRGGPPDARGRARSVWRDRGGGPRRAGSDSGGGLGAPCHDGAGARHARSVTPLGARLGRPARTDLPRRTPRRGVDAPESRASRVRQVDGTTTYKWIRAPRIGTINATSAKRPARSGLATKPTLAAEAAWRGETCQLEALPPNVIARLGGSRSSRRATPGSRNRSSEDFRRAREAVGLDFPGGGAA